MNNTLVHVQQITRKSVRLSHYVYYLLVDLCLQPCELFPRKPVSFVTQLGIYVSG